MKLVGSISIVSPFLSIMGVLFSAKISDMAYWGSGLMWFWIGVYCDYVCGLLAIVLAFIKKKKLKLCQTDVTIRALSITITTINICWTTFAVIAGLSGM